MGIVGVPVIDRDPVQPGAEVALHLGNEIAREGLEVRHLGGILRRSDEAEVVSVVMAASCERMVSDAVLSSAEHVRLLAVAGDAVAFQVSNVTCDRRCTKGTVSVPATRAFRMTQR